VSTTGPANDDTSSFSFNESVEELYEQAPCGYLTTTIDGLIVKVNRTFLDWVGYQSDELAGKKRLVDLLTVGGRMYFETHFNLLLRMQESVNEIALDVICRNGRILPALINARQKRDATGQPVLNRFTIFNATERRMYERDILAARDLFRTTLASIGDAVVATDAEGRITFMNGEAERLSGWRQDEALGKPVEDILLLQREDNQESIENPVKHAIRVAEVVGLANHTVLVSKDGRILTVDDSASPIRDGAGKVIGGVLVFRDVTERRNEQRALIEAQALAQSMIAELRRSNEDLSQFAAVASHDLRSPLKNVLTLAQLLERRRSDGHGDEKQVFEMLIASAKRMGALIEDLLRYARMTSEMTAPAEAVDANAQVAAAIQNLDASIRISGATVTYDSLPWVRIDETHLTQIFQNLIGNAIHYRGSDTPNIHISVADEGDKWLFSCADNGIGIASQYQAQIFEPFKRLHGHDRPGSGIGLAICKKIVERFGGRIWVESEETKGSSFLFTLPKGS
jgi:PAS domain S-box-containing protein